MYYLQIWPLGMASDCAELVGIYDWDCSRRSLSKELDLDTAWYVRSVCGLGGSGLCELYACDGVLSLFFLIWWWGMVLVP